MLVDVLCVYVCAVLIAGGFAVDVVFVLCLTVGLFVG